jgi:hypothetical protein
VDSIGRTIFVADAHRDDGKHFIVHADEKLTAFVELESAICAAKKPNQKATYRVGQQLAASPVVRPYRCSSEGQI